eukprot:TRINITY_DN14029_c0_g1_i1.p1 TRINITY_DN14029_c0_g1~~TRINITY_DN14029_c0_g1_i1.p1  ORF type:complete len:257 (-),score=84.77 TRINITY_DN14029_c0_g1_i1:56-826(-)
MSTSIWKNIDKSRRKVHKERHQPKSRKGVGFLEHKKDYVVRAKAFNKRKKKMLKLLRRASMKNPLEYNPAMIKSKLVKGKHQWDIEQKEMPDKEKIESLNVDLNYIRMRKQMEEKKIKRLKENLHCIGEAKPNRHIVFVSNQKEKDNFSVTDYFDTEKEFSSRHFNRPRKDQLKDENYLQGAIHTKNQLELINRLNNQKYKEINERITRKEDIDKLLNQLETNKNLITEEKKIEVNKTVDDDNNPVSIQWKMIRKK